MYTLADNTYIVILRKNRINLMVVFWISLLVGCRKDTPVPVEYLEPMPEDIIPGWIFQRVGARSPMESGSSNIDFVNEAIGFEYGIRGSIYKTINGGVDWFKLDSATDLYINNGYCVNPEEAFFTGVATENKSFEDGNKGTLLMHTKDGGVTFDKYYIQGYFRFDQIHFFSSDHGIAVMSPKYSYQGRQKVFSRTIDGGKTWELAEDLIVDEVSFKFFVRNKALILLAENYNFYYSIDQGETWDLRHFPEGMETHFRRIHVLSDKVIYVFYDEEVYKSTDGGQTWRAIVYDLNLLFTTHFVSENELIAAESYGFWDAHDNLHYSGTKLYHLVNEGEDWNGTDMYAPNFRREIFWVDSTTSFWRSATDLYKLYKN